MNKINAFLGQFTAECLETLSIVSYDFLIVAGLISLVLYIFGWEKGKNWSMMCPDIYVILQIIVKVISHA